jgi:hypothetical protein
VTISWGGRTPSRELTIRALDDWGTKAKQTAPFPGTNDVTSYSIQTPLLIDPLSPRGSLVAGLLFQVIVVSPQFVLAHLETGGPFLVGSTTQSRRVAR